MIKRYPSIPITSKHNYNLGNDNQGDEERRNNLAPAIQLDCAPP